LITIIYPNFITNDNKEIIQNIHILKTESLTNDMNNLGYTDFNICIQVNNNKIKNKSIDIINKYYHLDFILFNYDKIIKMDI
jgi:hypothetical protein